MESYRKYFDPQVLAKLEGLRLRAQCLVEGYVAGVHRSPFHGFSMEFAEHREYVPGDDLRYLDWKVFGRTDKYYLKRFEAETNLVCYLVLDSSQSMQFRGPDSPLSKYDYACCLAATLTWLVMQQQDSVSLATFDTDLRSLVGPGCGGAHLEQVIHAMEHAPNGNKTSIGAVLHQLSTRLAKRGVVVILSDLFDDVSSMIAGAKHLRHRRHDVNLLHLIDPAEIDFPFEKLTRFKGLENLADVVTDPESLRRAYQHEFQAFQTRVQNACRANQVNYQRIRTDESIDGVFSRLLAK